MRKRIAALCVILALVISALFSFGAAFADEKVYTPIGPNQSSDIIMEMQSKLAAGYFFEEGVQYTPGKYDPATADALRNYYDYKGWPFPKEGYIPANVVKDIVESQPRVTEVPTTPTPTPEPTATPFPAAMNLGDQSEALAQVQRVLGSKHYNDGLPPYTAGLMDDTTEKMLRRFCDATGQNYIGLTKDLYEYIMSDKAPDYAPPTATPFTLIPVWTESKEVEDAQRELDRLEYFRAYGEPVWGKFDEKTQWAVREFCKVNGIKENPAGMDPVIYQAIMDGKGLPNPPDRRDFRKGDKGEDVRAVQDKLNVLGYYSKDSRKVTGEYDDDTDAALKDFAKINNQEYDGETIPIALQDVILAESAKPYTETVEQVSFGEKTVDVFGMELPLWAVIAIAVVIVAALVFLLIMVFSKGGKDKKGSGAGGGSSDPNAKRLDLDIRYQGEMKSATITMDKPLRIGRNEKTLPLNPSDSDISRQHCQMSFRGDALILRDYSTNGTEVNGQSYHNCECVIHSGDTVKIGNHEIIVHF